MNREQGLVGDVEFRGNLGCSDNGVVEIRILSEGSRAINRKKPLDFKANTGLFKDLHGGIPWIRTLESRGVKESWIEYSVITSSKLKISASL